MGKSLIISSGVDTTTANTTAYCAPGGNIELVASEVTARVPFREPGVISNLSVIMWVNGVTGNSTVRLRKNGVNGNGLVTFGTSETGYDEDLVNTDTVDADDQISFMITHGGASGTLTITAISFVFTPTNPNITYTRFVQNFPSTYDASVIFHDTLNGVIQNVNTVIGNVQYKPGIAGIFKNFAVYSAAGGRAWGIRMPKNSVDDAVDRGAMATNATGLLEHTTSSVTIDNDDTISMLHVYGGGASNVRTVNFIAVGFEHTGNYFLLLNARADGNPSDFNTTRYLNIGGRIVNNSSELAALQRAKIPMRLSKLAIRTDQNNINTGTIVATLRKNSVDTALSVSIPAGAGGVGFFEDTTDTITVDEDDELSVKIVVPGSSGTVEFTIISMLAEYYPLRNLEMTITHALTLTSTHSRLRGRTRAITHALTLVSTHVRLRLLLQLATHTLTLTSSHTRLRGKWRTITHALTLASAHSRITNLLRTIIHSLTITSSHTRLKTILARVITHALTLTSSHTRLRGLIQTISHSLTLTHLFAQERAGVKLIFHALTFVSTHTRLKGHNRMISHNLAFTSTHNRFRGLIQTVSHTLALVSDHIRKRGLNQTATHTLTFTSNHVELRGKLRTVSHSLSLISTHTRLTTRIRTIIHSLTFASTHTRIRGLIQLASHSLAFVSDHIRKRGLIQTISHSLAFTSDHLRIRKLYQLVSHSLAFVSTHTASALRYFYIRRLRIRSNKQNV